MEFKSINPYNGKTLETFPEQTSQQVNDLFDKAGQGFAKWKGTSFAERSSIIANAGKILVKNMEEYARTMTLEMGKPIAESKAEIKKCAWVCDYYAQNAERFLINEKINTDAAESFVSSEPLGCILAIMPWNFPFWQVFRFAAPGLMAGNVGLLKHAPNVFRCAIQIEHIFKEAGCPDGVFQNLIVHHDKIETVIKNDIVKAVTLTGSERAGRSVASIAGKYLKKTVLELGGSNAFVVLNDADIEKSVELGIKARMLNTGQSCIAAKRFIVLDKIYDEYLSKFVENVQNLKTGNPLEETTEIGPLARKELADQLNRQVQESVRMGAKALLGGKQNDAFYEPTVLTNIKTDMPVFIEETFGPVAPIIKAKDEEEAFKMAGETRYGLGISVCTNNIDVAKKYIGKVDDGAYFVNELVKSDPRLPFGGTKCSGYGRELSRDGILEFVNRKTVYIKNKI